jgi:hypothetical protein
MWRACYNFSVRCSEWCLYSCLVVFVALYIHTFAFPEPVFDRFLSVPLSPPYIHLPEAV